MLAVAIPITRSITGAFVDYSVDDANNDNLSQSRAYAQQVEIVMTNFITKTKMTTNLLIQQFASEEERKRALDLVFYNDPDFVNIEIYQIKDGRAPELYRRETNEEYLKKYKLDRNYISKLRQIDPFPIASVFANKFEVRNTSQVDGAPLLTIGVPFLDPLNRVTHIAIADLRLEGLSASLPDPKKNSGLLVFLTDSRGSLIAHPDDKMVLGGYDMKNNDLVAKTLESTSFKGATRLYDGVTEDWINGQSYKNHFGIYVFAQKSLQVIMEPAQKAKIDAFAFAGYILSGALFFIFLFSLTLTSPIEKLHDVTLEVAHGNFDIKANIQSHDEVGELGRAFDGMIDGLKERDKVKNILNKFHGSSVTEDLLKGDLNLGGSRKQVTVFFSDIRDFTKFSEGHTPEEVVEMLNEYFQIMVAIITTNHGVVDKFVGDAIMAVWGAPNTTGNDSYYALKASLEMRMALAKLNELRLKRGHTPIKIGMGLHTGPAISGTIGSTERMEYTVIGDTVNMASRIESSTKSFGTDLLVSEQTSKELQGKFAFDLAGSAEVKGKSEPLKMFKVRGYVAENGQLVELKTPYSDYEAGHDAKVKVA